jgi:hypothetical protein
MTYGQVKGLRPGALKRLCGVRPETFRAMVEAVRQREAHKRKAGRPPKLAVEDQVLLALAYWREYRTFFHLAASWGLHEATVWRVVRRVEDVLIKCGRFRLPGKKQLRLADHQLEVIVLDVAESAVERPKKNSGATTAGRSGGTR